MKQTPRGRAVMQVVGPGDWRDSGCGLWCQTIARSGLVC
jgi:hypothetical protein